MLCFLGVSNFKQMNHNNAELLDQIEDYCLGFVKWVEEKMWEYDFGEQRTHTLKELYTYYKNHTQSSLLTLPLSGLKNLLCDVSQLIAGWNATDSEWSDWDEGVRKRVSELQHKIDVYGNVLFAQDYESPILENAKRDEYDAA